MVAAGDGAGEVVGGVAMPVILAVVVGAAILLLLVVRGAGKANEVAEQQEAALAKQMADDAAMERLTR